MPQYASGPFVAIDVALIERNVFLSETANDSMQLKLKNMRHEIPIESKLLSDQMQHFLVICKPHVFHTIGHMVLGTGIKVFLTSPDRWRNTLPQSPKIPPMSVHVSNGHSSREDIVTPFIHNVCERKKDNIVQGHFQLKFQIDLVHIC